MLKVTRGLTEKWIRPHPVVTIGNFDGHHLGHRALLRTVVATAREARGTAVVLTFEPHPVKILAPQVELCFLTSAEEKLVYLDAAGIDEVIYLNFNPFFAAMSPEQFVEDILHQSLAVSEVFVGQHFAFGHGRTGRIQDLVRLGGMAGFRVHPVSPLMNEGEVVSSTRIRQLIQSGNLERATTLLGRLYGVCGTVIHGMHQGQAMGWPTANLRPPKDRVLPPDGVYAARLVHGQVTENAIAYIGTRPTFGVGERLIEVNLLDQTCDLYSQQITVYFVAWVRGDHTFLSAEKLSQQIVLDVAQARQILERIPLGIQ